MTWWVHDAFQTGGPVLVFSWVFWVIASITLHELAHGWVAIRQGDNTPRQLGHMTLNPIVHMGWMSLFFFALAGFAWGLMPTDPSRYRNRRLGRVLVAAAGPMMNLLLSVLSLSGMSVWLWAIATHRIEPAEHTARNVLEFLYMGGFLNIVLCAFNLLPVPPLDGSAILGGVSRRLDAFFDRPGVRMYGMLVVLLVFFQVLDRPLQDFAQTFSSRLATAVYKMLPGETQAPEIGRPAADPAAADPAR